MCATCTHYAPLLMRRFGTVPHNHSSCKVLSETAVLEKKLEKLYDFGSKYFDMPEVEPKNVVTPLFEHQKKVHATTFHNTTVYSFSTTVSTNQQHNVTYNHSNHIRHANP